MTKEIRWSDKDTKVLRHLRECLTNGSVNLVFLNDLLTALEGKVSPPPMPQQKTRRNLNAVRVARRFEQITGGRVKERT